MHVKTETEITCIYSAMIQIYTAILSPLEQGNKDDVF
jgi:hypothetical protein